MDKERGRRIRKLMQAKGFTRDSFAVRSGYSISTISKIRNGHDFTTEAQRVLCDLLKTTPNYIHGYKVQNPEIQEIIDSLYRLNDSQLNTIILALVNHLSPAE